MSSLKRRVSDLERIATAQRTTPDETVEQTRARYRGFCRRHLARIRPGAVARSDGRDGLILPSEGVWRMCPPSNYRPILAKMLWL